MGIPVFIAQLRARTSKEEQLRVIEKLAGKAEPGGILAVPEYAMYDVTGRGPETLRSIAEPLDGPWVSRLRRISREKGICMIATLHELNPRGKPYNTAVVIDERGEIVGVYRKTHLFDALGYRESDYYTPGDKLFEPVKACGARLGLAICFEIRYPEVFRYQALRGAEIVFVPSAWYRGEGKEEQYEYLARARAHENTVWIVAPILYGEHFTGRSKVVDPYGIVRVDAGYGERLVAAEVKTDYIAEVRRILPLLDLRRPGLYG